MAHPIQDATDDEMRAKCRAVFQQVVSGMGEVAAVPAAAATASKL